MPWTPAPIDDPACPWCGDALRQHFTVPASVRVTSMSVTDGSWWMDASEDYETHDGIGDDDHFGCARYEHVWPDLDAYMADVRLVWRVRQAFDFEGDEDPETMLNIPFLRVLYRYPGGRGLRGPIAQHTRDAEANRRRVERMTAIWHRRGAEKDRAAQAHAIEQTGGDLYAVTGVPA